MTARTPNITRHDPALQTFLWTDFTDTDEMLPVEVSAGSGVTVSFEGRGSVLVALAKTGPYELAIKTDGSPAVSFDSLGAAHIQNSDKPRWFKPMAAVGHTVRSCSVTVAEPAAR